MENCRLRRHLRILQIAKALKQSTKAASSSSAHYCMRDNTVVIACLWFGGYRCLSQCLSDNTIYRLIGQFWIHQVNIYCTSSAPLICNNWNTLGCLGYCMQSCYPIIIVCTAAKVKCWIMFGHLRTHFFYKLRPLSTMVV